MKSQEKQKPGHLSRQPGYLSETRSFPPPTHNGFGFFLDRYDKHIFIFLSRIVIKDNEIYLWMRPETITGNSDNSWMGLGKRKNRKRLSVAHCYICAAQNNILTI
jgi:hypothetical protein